MNKTLMIAGILAAAGIAGASSQVFAEETTPVTDKENSESVLIADSGNEDATTIDVTVNTGNGDTKDPASFVNASAADSDQTDTKAERDPSDTLTFDYAELDQTVVSSAPAETYTLTAPAATPTVSPVQNGWNEDRTSWYENGKLYSGEKYIDGYWYNFGADGKKSIGFTDLNYNEKKTVYYDQSGHMLYGQQFLNNYWYCFHLASGKMFTGLTYLDASYEPAGAKTVYYNEKGQMQYGAQTVNGQEMYFRPGYGSQVTNAEVKVGNSYYYYNNKGVKATGEQQVNGHWRYYNPKNNGAKAVSSFVDLTKAGDHTDQDKTVYYDGSGNMVYGQKQLDGYWYCFQLGSGKMLTGLTYLDRNYQSDDPKTVYYNEKGQMQYGAQTVNGQEMYFRPGYGSQVTNAEVKVGNSYYYYNNKGVKATGEQQVNGHWRYYNPKNNGAKAVSSFISLTKAGDHTDQDKTVYYDGSGNMLYGQQKLGNYWYCFQLGSGRMFTGLTYLDRNYQPDDPKTVYYDDSGRMQYGVVTVGNRVYSFDKATGAQLDGTLRNETINGKTGLICYGKDGLKATGQQQISGKWYFFNPEDNGFAATGLTYLSSKYESAGAKTVFYNSDGTMFYGEKTVDGSVRYFKHGSGAMAIDEVCMLPGSQKVSYYDKNGHRLQNGTVIKNRMTFYADGNGSIYRTDVNNVSYLQQNDPRWAWKVVGYYNFGPTGCVPTTLTMIINRLKRTNMNPYDLGVELHNAGLFNINEGGAFGDVHPYIASHYGLKIQANANNTTAVGAALKAGGLICALMGPGYFVDGSYTHAVMMYGYNNGYVNVYDPIHPGANGSYLLANVINQKSYDSWDAYNGSYFISYTL